MAETKSKLWFKDNVSENEAELIQIGELANKMLYDKINLGINDPRTTIAIYAKIFDEVCNVVVSKQDEWDEFWLTIADRLQIGYTTTTSEDDEKQGNFMVFIKHIESKQKDDPLDEEEEDTIALCTQWNAENIRTQADIIKEIASRAKKKLEEIINIKIASCEFVIPMFCIIHSQIVNYIRLKRIEEDKSEYEINVAGLYTIGIQETEDAEEDIYFVPSISLKLKFKNDAQASSKNE